MLWATTFQGPKMYKQKIVKSYGVPEKVLQRILVQGSNPGEGMNVCKCLVPSQHGGTLDNRRTTSHLVRLVEGEERWEAHDHPQGVLPQNWGGIEKLVL
ncbi:uncharacterized protein TNCV_1062481 [Trichonephila clavipes]|nr:uncharacterized protein TNCV_1062481 [Trichonephila clavipes]